MAKANTNTEETKVEETKVEEMKPSKVDVFIPRGSNANDDPNMFVSVNGVNYLLPRGKMSTVPVAVAEEIQRAARAQNTLDEHIDEMRGASK